MVAFSQSQEKTFLYAMRHLAQLLQVLLKNYEGIFQSDLFESMVSFPMMD